MTLFKLPRRSDGGFGPRTTNAVEPTPPPDDPRYQGNPMMGIPGFSPSAARDLSTLDAGNLDPTQILTDLANGSAGDVLSPDDQLALQLIDEQRRRQRAELSAFHGQIRSALTRASQTQSVINGLIPGAPRTSSTEGLYSEFEPGNDGIAGSVTQLDRFPRLSTQVFNGESSQASAWRQYANEQGIIAAEEDIATNFKAAFDAIDSEAALATDEVTAKARRKAIEETASAIDDANKPMANATVALERILSAPAPNTENAGGALRAQGYDVFYDALDAYVFEDKPIDDFFAEWAADQIGASRQGGGALTPEDIASVEAAARKNLKAVLGTDYDRVIDPSILTDEQAAVWQDALSSSRHMVRGAEDAQTAADRAEAAKVAAETKAKGEASATLSYGRDISKRLSAVDLGGWSMGIPESMTTKEEIDDFLGAVVGSFPAIGEYYKKTYPDHYATLNVRVEKFDNKGFIKED